MAVRGEPGVVDELLTISTVEPDADAKLEALFSKFGPRHRRDTPVWARTAFRSLPDDCLVTVFFSGFLGAEAVRMALVSRSFMQLAKLCETLSLAECGLDDAGVVGLASLFPRLHTLAATKCRLTDTGLARLGCSLPRLRTLRLPSSRLTLAPLTPAAQQQLRDDGLPVDVPPPAAADDEDGERQVEEEKQQPATTAPLLLFPALRQLDLSCCRHITDEGLAALARSGSKLERLNLRGCYDITDAGLAALIHCPALRSVDVGGCSMLTNRSMELFAALPQLEEVTVTGLLRVTPEGIAALAGCKSLRRLAMSNCVASDEALLALAKALPDLVSLNIGGVEGVSDASVAELQRLRKLQQLNLRGLPITDVALAGFARLTELRVLKLGGSGRLTSAALLTLPLARLQALELACLHRLDDSALATLADCASLVDLDLGGDMGITRAGFRQLAALPRLRTLSLRKTRAQPGDIAALLPQLRSLNVESCSRMADEDLLAIAASMPQLRQLNIAHCPALTDHSIAALGSLSALTRLSLRGNRSLTGSTMHALATTRLQEVDLSWCIRLRNDGVRSLALVKSLESINLMGCHALTDAGVIALRSLKQLRSVSLIGCRMVSKHMAARLAGRRAVRASA
eukprot:PLAT15535.2.p1 GENE.PLAT15535.2~~PLAT15535.2.p1  ORF type:complete len:630 (-),score=336.95 PLAT15535.2:103-1992(-)